MSSHGYKKYMKKDVQSGNPLLRIFVISFFGMLLFFTFLIKSFSPTVDTSIGDYQQPIDETIEQKKVVDNRLEAIQNEDQGRSFSDLMANADKQNSSSQTDSAPTVSNEKTTSEIDNSTAYPANQTQDIVYKVYVGSYTSAEQAKVAKDIILESGSGLNPIVKCIGTNNYVLQVGIFKNKNSADAMLNSVRQSGYQGRIVEDY